MWCFAGSSAPDAANRGLAIREPSHRFYSRQAVPDLNQTLHRPFVNQFLQLLLACEATVARIPICWLVFVYHSDVIFRCDMKKHRFIARFRYSVAALPITSITPQPQKSKSKCQPKKVRPTAWIRYCCDWTSAPYISLRSGMFKHPQVVSITAASSTRNSNRRRLIPPNPTASVAHLPIRQMLAAPHSHPTQVVQQLQSRERTERTRAKVLYIPKRSCDDSCNT